MDDLTSVEKYKQMSETLSAMPSGASFRLKRRLDYRDYIELLNLLSKETGKQSNTDLLDEVAKDYKLLAKALSFVVPRMCLEPKVSAEKTEGSLSLDELSLDDLLFIYGQAMRIELRPEIKPVMDSFRNK